MSNHADYVDRFSPPKLIRLDDILPDEPLLLMGAGPVPLPNEVSRANGVVINHLGKDMNKVIAGLQEMARYAFQTKSKYIIGVGGPSSAAMEMAVSNLAWPGRRVLSLVNKHGVFGPRLEEMARRTGADVDVLSTEDIETISPKMVEKKLQTNKYDVVTIVQGETSSGVHNIFLPEIAKLVKDHGALFIVDAVCTLTTMPFLMDEWGIDAVITGGQKGLSSIPGVSLLALSDKAWETIEKRKHPLAQWTLDAKLAWQFWGHQKYHYTAPVPGVLAMYEALRLVSKETLEARMKRHLASSLAMQAGIVAMGLELYVPERQRLASVISIKVPDGVDAVFWQRYMVEHYGVEISGSFGLPVLRVGQMGEQCRAHCLFRTLYALGMAAQQVRISVDVANGMAELERQLEAAEGVVL